MTRKKTGNVKWPSPSFNDVDSLTKADGTVINVTLALMTSILCRSVLNYGSSLT